MSLVFAAIAPHPPMLIPAIGKDHIEAIQKTKDALARLEQDLYIAKPQVIIIISPHGSLFANAFSVNAHTSFSTLFEQFGDLTTKKEWRGAPEIAATIAAEAAKRRIPVQLVSQDKIDHGASIPLFALTGHLPDVRVLPIGFNGASPDNHLAYGELLKEVMMNEDKRIALIASADLSHCLTVNAPVDFHADGEAFDQKIIAMLEVRNTAGIAGMEPAVVANAAECGYRSILIALGALKNVSFSFSTYSYESPFGVGYLVGNFIL
jgi:AmmeMemoRadiSam system protein B